MTNENNRIMLVVALAAAMSGCASGDPAGAEPGVAGSGLAAANGLMRNGLMRNGLMRNGLMRNGLMRNGLTTIEFQSWFDEDPATSAEVMEHLVRCAAPAGVAYTFTNPTTGVAYAWTGSLGLAPGFASGLEATVAEQQVLSACLAAHTNYFGQHVDMAVEGYRADGAVIPKVPDELQIYSVREAAFFGNLFEVSGPLYSCRDHKERNLAYSSARACAFDYKKDAAPGDLCAPIVFLGACSDYCVWSRADSAYTSCTFSGQVYRPLTTRILPTDVYLCGDGVCQITESCGTESLYDNCRLDCGTCPTVTDGSTTTSSTTTSPTTTSPTTTSKTNSTNKTP